MQIALHKNARTTPAIRKEIQTSGLPIKALARKYGLTPATVRKWRSRRSVEDGSHRPHTLHTTLTPHQEEIVIALRTSLLLPMDDLLAVTREFINDAVSRSGMDRCLRRHGVSRLKDLIPQEDTPRPKHKTFKDYEPGFLHVDIKYLPKMPDEDNRRYLCVAIDRATRWVYLELLPDKTAAQAAGFLKRLLKACPVRVQTILTDNGKEFTDRYCATGEREPTGEHLFDKVCTTERIEHRLTKPRHPQTNGMVKRFNGRISEILNTTRFDSSWNLEQTLTNYAKIYNHHIPQKALGHIAPIQALKKWQKTHPELFTKKVLRRFLWKCSKIYPTTHSI